MQLNPAVAVGAAMAGGGVGGFVGAFFALPIAAIVQSFLSTYSKRYEVTELRAHRAAGAEARESDTRTPAEAPRPGRYPGGCPAERCGSLRGKG